MATRPMHNETLQLTNKQIICIFHDSSMSLEEVLSINQEDITYKLLTDKGVKALNLSVAKIGPSKLKKMGMQNAAQLRAFGFDTLYLSDSRFTSEAIHCFGSRDVKMTYVQSASDAVAISGTDSMHLLGINVTELLMCCAGAPLECRAVLEQIPGGSALQGVPCSVILDTGIRSRALMELGYSLTAVVKQTGATVSDLFKLGFSLR
jgi:hypothetical protein